MSKANAAENLNVAMRQLRHFLLVAEEGSFQSAATKAFRSQPAITKSIQAVERSLGHPLFEPGQRSTLTGFGQACRPLVEEVLLHYDRTLAAMQSLAAGASGRVVLASIASVASNWLPPILKRFMREHPDVDLRLREGNSENIQRMVLSGEVDLGIASPVATDQRLRLAPLMENPFGFVCQPDHPLAGRRRLKWADLAGAPLIATTVHRQLHDARALQHFSGAKLRVEGVLTLLALVRQGVGVTVLPEIVVPRGDRALAFIALAEPRLSRHVYAMRLADRTPAAAATAMLELLLSAAAPHARGTSGARQAAAERAAAKRVPAVR